MRGRGIAFGRYENTGAYVARSSPKVRWAQIEGNVIHSLGRTLKEQLRFDRNAVTTLSWGRAQFNPDGHQAMRFQDIPDIEIVLVEDPFDPAHGAEAPASIPTAAGVANAIFDAKGARVQRTPITIQTVLAVDYPYRVV